MHALFEETAKPNCLFVPNEEEEGWTPVPRRGFLIAAKIKSRSPPKTGFLSN